MARIYIICISLFLCTFSVFAQDDQNKQREKYEKELQKKQNEMISEFVEDLEVDQFQREIITQKLHSYVQKKQAILRAPGREFEKKEQIDYLDDTHFADLSQMASNEVMLEIRDFVTMNQAQKKKKKKKKKKKRNKKSKEDPEQI